MLARRVQDRHGQLSFLYDEAYRRRPDATPLSLSMPLSQASHPHRTVDAFLRGLLPDSEAVLRPGHGRSSPSTRLRMAPGGLPTGRNATTHIVKPALPYLADQDVNEHLCLRAARKLGLRVAHSEIMQFGNERAIVLRRYDRAQRPDGEVLRIHQEDFCQALAVPPSRKYEREDGGPGVLQMAARRRGSAVAAV